MRTMTGLRLLAAGHCRASPRRSAAAADKLRVGEGPFITGGGFYVARDKGYFTKLGIEIETKPFIDGALAVPSFVAGELDHDLHDRQRQPVQQRRQGCAARGDPRPRPQPEGLRLYADQRHPGAARPRRELDGRFRQAQGQEDRRRRARQHQSVQHGAGAREGRPRSSQGRAMDRQRLAARPDEDARTGPGGRDRPRLAVRRLRAEQQMGPDRRHRRPDRARCGDRHVRRAQGLPRRRTATS